MEGEALMAQLVVRTLEEDVVRALKLRAATHGRSAEEEHREILRQALVRAGAGTRLEELLLQMPDVGDDEDFERSPDLGRSVDL